MFERRLHILLVGLAVGTVTLFGRAFWLQVVRGADYVEAERRLSVRPPELTATTRGRILDRTGAVLAVDTACTDACVDYRAITDEPDAKWVEEVATARLRARFGPDFRRQFPLDRRKAMLAEAEAGVTADVSAMWDTLATLYQPTEGPAAAAAAAADPRAAMDEVRRAIVRQVEARRRVSWTNAYRRGRERARAGGGWLRWVGLGGRSQAAADADPNAIGPDIDAFEMTLDEQRQPHVVLHALDDAACALLGTRLDRLPGLSLRPSTHRSYPMRDVFCHAVGRVGNPTAEELRRTENDDPRTRYETADSVGRDGVEVMCEPLLRGQRGRIDRAADDADLIVDRQPFVAGRDVRVTVDADLQARAQQLLKHVVIHDGGGRLVTPAEGVGMHAAVVVLDVATNQVLALASNPTFDVNELEGRYAALAGDTLEEPLRDRAIDEATAPGSTVKPMVGIGAITQGAISPYEGIECTGFLRLPVRGPDGRPTGKVETIRGQSRCWVVSEHPRLAELTEMSLKYPGTWPQPITTYAHHPIPLPHKGIFGNDDGFLCFSDAVERSCNVYFETVADRMGPASLDRWMTAFGIGRPTGIGLPGEARGQHPGQYRGDPGRPEQARLTYCLDAIGQGTVIATPLQIANEAATFARRGVWMRPRLLMPADQSALDAAAHPPAVPSVDRLADPPADAVDLHLDPAGLEQAKMGMKAVVHETDIWTGCKRPGWLTLAAKTGTADVPPVQVWVDDGHGRRVKRPLAADARGGPETATPWYRSAEANPTSVTQCWYMGYAPADDPQVAFAVLVEYAGSSGGAAAGPVAAGVLDACVDRGYLRPPAATTRLAGG